VEFDAPLLTPFSTLDANILSIAANVSDGRGQSRRLFLHTSPEHAMKKLLAAGAKKIYYLGKVFRNGELTRLHNPEFMMAEWYRAGANYHDIQQDTENLIRYVVSALNLPDEIVYQNQKLDLSPDWSRIALRHLFGEKTGKNLAEVMDLSAMRNLAQSLSVSIDNQDDWESIFFKIYLERIEPGLGLPRPIFIQDYPANMGLMARRKSDDPDWVERTELYMGGLELANGYSELTDPAEQRARFIEDQARKRMAGENYPLDEELIDALESGLPPCAGIALGVDRLIMILMNKNNIEDVIPFPILQM
jgi:lysyl-tRNA synthetase class 2